MVTLERMNIFYAANLLLSTAFSISRPMSPGGIVPLGPLPDREPAGLKGNECRGHACQGNGTLGPNATGRWDGSATQTDERRRDERELPWMSTGPARKHRPQLQQVNSMLPPIRAFRPPLTHRKRATGRAKFELKCHIFGVVGSFLLDNRNKGSYGCLHFLLLAW